VITILIEESARYIDEYTIGKAISYVKEENAQNSTASKCHRKTAIVTLRLNDKTTAESNRLVALGD